MTACAAELIAAQPGAPAIIPSSRLATMESEPVRKVVTVVFCDLVGSTELAAQLDPEETRAVLAGYFAAVRAAAERHGGVVEKYIGDAVMAVFGIPQMHEDDA